MYSMVSATAKTAGATVLVVFGAVGLVVVMVIPTGGCVGTTVDGEFVEQQCRHNASLALLLRALFVVMLVSLAGGLVAQWRASRDAGRVTNLVSGVVLTLFGLLLFWNFGYWLWSLVVESAAWIDAGYVGVAALVAFAAIGLLTAVVGGVTLSRSYRRW